MFKSGYIAVIGRPNAGKSTLVNALVGEALMVVTPKPQTTRHSVLGIKTSPEAQLIFVDTPGIHRSLAKALNEIMVEAAHEAARDADVVLLLVDPFAGETGQIHEEDLALLGPLKGKDFILVLNKADRGDLSRPEAAWRGHLGEKIPILKVSALKGQNLEALESLIVQKLPEGPCYFPEDQLTDRTERFWATEVIREQVIHRTRQEIPYAVAVIIEEWKEGPGGPRPRKTYIRAALIVERDSQKVIVIGSKGAGIREIGKGARLELEKRLGRPVYLELFVRVEADWSKDPAKVREFLG